MRYIRRFPLFYKVLIANSLQAIIGTLIAIWLANLHGGDPGVHVFRGALVLWLVLVILVITVLMNYLILRGALQPIETLRQLASDLEAGQVNARATPPFFADGDTERLMTGINQTLEQLQHYQERVKLLSQRGTQLLEAERKRISAELHDETSQVLTALLITERMLLNSLDNPAHKETVQQMLDTTRSLLVDVQRICVGLRPPVLDDLGLPGALRSYAEGFLPKGSLHSHMEVEERLPRFSTDIELALYRIAQEALTNVVRHAHAQNIWLSLELKDNYLLLTVRDDGVGFDQGIATETISQEHLGLFGMQERATLVGGEVSVQSLPGKGTVVKARIPVNSGVAA